MFSARVELPRHRIGEIEAVEREIRLAGSAAVHVNAAVDVLHHALQQRKGVAQILRIRERRLQNLDAVELLLLGRLLRDRSPGASRPRPPIERTPAVIQREVKLVARSSKVELPLKTKNPGALQRGPYRRPAPAV